MNRRKNALPLLRLQHALPPLLILLLAVCWSTAQAQGGAIPSSRRFDALRQIFPEDRSLIDIAFPGEGDTLGTSGITVQGTIDESIIRVDCGDSTASIDGTVFTCAGELDAGENLLVVKGQDAAGKSAFSTRSVFVERPLQIELNLPIAGQLFTDRLATVEGTISDSSAQVEINGIIAQTTGSAFRLVDIPLREGNNLLNVVARTPEGRLGQASVEVVFDSTPPRVAIITPAESYISREPSLVVGGVVNDLTVGTVNADQVSVGVNGIAAAVSNRRFLARGVPLNAGANSIVVTATDQAGNTAADTVVVSYIALRDSAQIRSAAGDAQEGAVGSLLPEPLIAVLEDSTGRPVANRPVLFQVRSGDGRLQGSNYADGGLLRVLSDAEGKAQARWLLGTRAGVGSERVEARAEGFAGVAIFSATALPGAAGKIVVDMGNSQVGAVNQPLAHAFVAIVNDEGQSRLAGVEVEFAVVEGGGHFNGETRHIVRTDGDGRALAVLTLGRQAGIENNVVEARFPDHAGLPATFVASALVVGDPAATQISGVVVDNADTPIAGVTVHLENETQSVRTDAEGQFVLRPVPVGSVHLIANGSTAEREGSWPTLMYEMETVAGQDNTLGMPVYLLPLDLSSSLAISETEGGVLTLPQVPGYALEVAPGSATFTDGSKSGQISVTQVHSDKVPMVPVAGLAPRFVITIQPAGVLFDPPAAMTIPNVDGLAPRAVTEMYSFDHDLGQFVSIGTGTVSDDGTVVRTDPGVGVRKAGWHFTADRPPPPASWVLPARPGATDPPLDENCTVNINNRIARFRPSGSARVDNIPIRFSPTRIFNRMRARITCKQDGQTLLGQTDFFTLRPNGTTVYDGPIHLEKVDPIPVSLALSAHDTLLTEVGQTVQIRVRGHFADGSTGDLTPAEKGTDYAMSNAAIATIDTAGQITAVASGTVLVTAMNAGALGMVRLRVQLSDDRDGDGIANDLEQLNGLNPGDPADAQQDPDEDGLDNRAELVQHGTEIALADTDGDGIADGEEVEVGVDGYVTNPLLADTDGDGLRDPLEIAVGSDPTDAASTNLAEALDSLAVTPRYVQLSTVDSTAASFQQLTVTGYLRDGQTLDLTSQVRGTSYVLNDSSVCKVGPPDGRVHARTQGRCEVIAANSSFMDTVFVAIDRSLFALDIPGRPIGLAVRGGYAYVAANTEGLQIVDVSNPQNSRIVGSFGDSSATGFAVKDVQIRDGKAYIAIGKGGMKIVDVEDPANPVLVSELTTAFSSSFSATDLELGEDVVLLTGWNRVRADSAGFRLIRAYVTTQVIDISDMNNPILVGSVDFPELPGLSIYRIWARSALHAEQTLAVTISGNAVHIVDLNDRRNPVITGSIPDVGLPTSVVIKDSLAFIATTENLLAVDFSDPTEPAVVETILDTRSFSITIWADWLLVATSQRFHSIDIVDISDPRNPAIQSKITLNGFPIAPRTRIDSENGFAYMTTSSGLLIEPLPSQVTGRDSNSKLVSFTQEAIQAPLSPLVQNFPNPFNSYTQIAYQLSAPGDVRLSVYNMLGQIVRVLVDERQVVGSYRMAWDGRDQSNRPVASGIYFYRLVGGNFMQTKRMLLLR